MTSSPAATASTRSASSVSRSRNAAVAPPDFASATSSALASRIADRAWRMALAMPASASFFRAAGASASACAALRASRPIAHMAAARLPGAASAVSGAFMALIRLAFAASYHVPGSPARQCGAPVLSTQFTAVRGAVTKSAEPHRSGPRFANGRNERVRHGRIDGSFLPCFAGAITGRCKLCRRGIWRRVRELARDLALRSDAGWKPHQCSGRFRPAGGAPALLATTQPLAAQGEKPPARDPKKNFNGARNPPTVATLTIQRRAKPPSPSPSITRR